MIGKIKQLNLAIEKKIDFVFWHLSERTGLLYSMWLPEKEYKEWEGKFIGSLFLAGWILIILFAFVK